MGFLIAIAVVTGACYAPDIHDCALACATDTDCVRGQVCTADHWCAAPALAGGCGAPDAGVDGRPDAAPEPVVDLRIHIDGSGYVTITDGGTCDAADCTIPVPWNVPTTLTALPHGNHPFDKWTSMTCMNQGAMCTFTPRVLTMVSVKFK